MSTRAGITVKDGKHKLHFYRHSDGYPEGTLPILNKFIDKVKAGEIRDNIGQAAGWLIELGRQEMIECFDGKISENYTWKVGFIEPTTDVKHHGDLEYKYVIDLETKEVTYKQVRS